MKWTRNDCYSQQSNSESRKLQGVPKNKPKGLEVAKEDQIAHYALWLISIMINRHYLERQQAFCAIDDKQTNGQTD